MGKAVLAGGKGGQRCGRIESLPSEEEGMARLGRGQEKTQGPASALSQ